jgi:hypothetical protein
MTSTRSSHVSRSVAVLLATSLVATPAAASGVAQTAGQQQGQSQSQTTGTQSGQATTNAPVDLEKIKKAIQADRPLDLSTDRLRFYSLVLANQIDVEKLFDNYDMVNGPTRGGAAMTHQEFLNMVTPKEMYSSAGIQAYELVQWSVVNLLGHALIRRAIEDLKNAKTEREIAEIRARIDRELAALRAGGGGGR